jgi:hypothetical protein
MTYVRQFVELRTLDQCNTYVRQFVELRAPDQRNRQQIVHGCRVLVADDTIFLVLLRLI